MTNIIYLYHHLGLGDHIICNSIVRIYCERYSKVFLFVKPHNYFSVEFMYRDINNIEFICADDFGVERFIKSNGLSNIVRIGFDRITKETPFFDLQFYDQVNLSFDTRWDNFYIERDRNSEQQLLQRYGLKSGSYIFIHDDPDRNYTINEKYITNRDIPCFRPQRGVTANIFDYCSILANAYELHCIDSSFRLIADSIPLETEKLFFHLSYINKDYYYSSSKKNWQII